MTNRRFFEILHSPRHSAGKERAYAESQAVHDRRDRVVPQAGGRLPLHGRVPWGGGRGAPRVRGGRRAGRADDVGGGVLLPQGARRADRVEPGDARAAAEARGEQPQVHGARAEGLAAEPRLAGSGDGRAGASGDLGAAVGVQAGGSGGTGRSWRRRSATSSARRGRATARRGGRRSGRPRASPAWGTRGTSTSPTEGRRCCT